MSCAWTFVWTYIETCAYTCCWRSVICIEACMRSATNYWWFILLGIWRQSVIGWLDWKLIPTGIHLKKLSFLLLSREKRDDRRETREERRETRDYRPTYIYIYILFPILIPQKMFPISIPRKVVSYTNPQKMSPLLIPILFPIWISTFLWKSIKT